MSQFSWNHVPLKIPENTAPLWHLTESPASHHGVVAGSCHNGHASSKGRGSDSTPQVGDGGHSKYLCLDSLPR